MPSTPRRADSARVGVWLFPDRPAPAVAALAADVEAAGLDEFWLGDEGPGRDPFALLAGSAIATRRIRLGVAVTNPYLRHPSVTAAAMATVAEWAPGRVVLGIGPGGDMALGPAEVRRERPLAAVERAVRIARAVANGERTEGYAPPPHAITSPGLAIYIGARAERLNRLASAVADGVFLGGIPASMYEQTLAWARAVRPIDAAIYVNAAFGREAADAVAPQMIYAYLDAPETTRERVGLRLADVVEAVGALSAGDEAPARRLLTTELLDDVLVAGSPEEIGRSLAARVRKLSPTSVGFALIGEQTHDILERVAKAGEIFRKEIA